MEAKSKIREGRGWFTKTKKVGNDPHPQGKDPHPGPEATFTMWEMDIFEYALEDISDENNESLELAESRF